MGDLVPRMQHVLPIRTFIWPVYRQPTAASIALENQKKINNPGHVHEAKTIPTAYNSKHLTVLENVGTGTLHCTVNGGVL